MPLFIIYIKLLILYSSFLQIVSGPSLRYMFLIYQYLTRLSQFVSESASSSLNISRYLVTTSYRQYVRMIHGRDDLFNWIIQIPLLRAAELGHLEIIKLLLDHLDIDVDCMVEESNRNRMRRRKDTGRLSICCWTEALVPAPRIGSTEHHCLMLQRKGTVRLLTYYSRRELSRAIGI